MSRRVVSARARNSRSTWSSVSLSTTMRLYVTPGSWGSSTGAVPARRRQLLRAGDTAEHYLAQEVSTEWIQRGGGGGRRGRRGGAAGVVSGAGVVLRRLAGGLGRLATLRDVLTCGVRHHHV